MSGKIRKLLDEAIFHLVSIIPPSTYSFEHDEMSSKYSIKLNTGGALINCHKYPDKFDCFYLDSKSGSKIACVWIKNYQAPQYTILFSHGGTIDLGSLVNFLFILSQRLSVNILIYDYAGFGVSTGKPSEASIYRDAETVYEFLFKQIPTQQIILYGQSMGTAPTLHLASTIASDKVKAIVLHSSFLSMVKLYFPNVLSKAGYFYDFFKNYEMIEKINLPILVIHGTTDVVAPLEHGKKLYELAKNKLRPCWIEGGGHDDLYAFDAYMKRLKRFVEFDLEQL